MPLLPNGKIDRKSLPEVQVDFSVENVEPENAMEEHFLRAAYEAMDYYQKYRVSDVMRYITIRAMIHGNPRIYWQYSAYDPVKPYLVFVYGIAPVAKTL